MCVRAVRLRAKLNDREETLELVMQGTLRDGHAIQVHAEGNHYSVVREYCVQTRVGLEKQITKDNRGLTLRKNLLR